MRVLVTFPGKFGDLLWALPTIRAIARRVGEPVDLWVAKPFASITPLLMMQPYLGMVAAIDTWEVRDTAPISPRAPAILDALPTKYEAILNLGYRDWPIPDVAIRTRMTAIMEGQAAGVFSLEEEWSFDPWIDVPAEETLPGHWPWPWVYGFTDEHFELKVGLVTLLEQKPHWWKNQHNTLSPTTIGANPRWQAEAGYFPTSWIDSARMLKHTQVFLGDCSALHVLAVAMGVPVVLMEPNEHRWNDVFYPLGRVGPRVTVVMGNDHRPTWDSRHVRDVLEGVLHARQAAK